MSLRWEPVVVDARDPSALGRWWADALGWEVDADDSFGVEIKPRSGVGPGPALVFVPGPAKADKNRARVDRPGTVVGRAGWSVMPARQVTGGLERAVLGDVDAIRLRR
jgi:hypothetical protein